MDDGSVTQLLARMDAHLERQDAYLQQLLEGQRQDRALLARVGEMLATTAREVVEIHAEASRGFAGAMHLLSNLITRLEGPR